MGPDGDGEAAFVTGVTRWRELLSEVASVVALAGREDLAVKLQRILVEVAGRPGRP